jgi:hypothetical protein
LVFLQLVLDLVADDLAPVLVVERFVGIFIGILGVRGAWLVGRDQGSWRVEVVLGVDLLQTVLTVFDIVVLLDVEDLNLFLRALEKAGHFFKLFNLSSDQRFVVFC